MSTLGLDELVDYADVCGQALAQPHARSDAETGIMAGDAETKILSSITPELFRGDVVEFAELAARRIYADHAMFRSDHRSGRSGTGKATERVAWRHPRLRPVSALAGR